MKDNLSLVVNSIRELCCTSEGLGRALHEYWRGQDTHTIRDIYDESLRQQLLGEDSLEVYPNELS